MISCRQRPLRGFRPTWLALMRSRGDGLPSRAGGAFSGFARGAGSAGLARASAFARGGSSGGADGSAGSGSSSM